MAALTGGMFHLRRSFDRDLTSFGRPTRDLVASETDFTVKLVDFLQGGEKSCNGQEIVHRMEDYDGVAGYRHLEAMTRDQDAIPVEWRDFILLAPKTILAMLPESEPEALISRHQLLVFSGIYWNEGDNEWQMKFYSCSIENFDATYRIVTAHNL